MGKSKKRPDPISNNDYVMAHLRNNKTVKVKFGELKKKYIEGTLPFIVEKVYLPRKNKYYQVWYSPTKGFTFELLK